MNTVPMKRMKEDLIVALERCSNCSRPISETEDCSCQLVRNQQVEAALAQNRVTRRLALSKEEAAVVERHSSMCLQTLTYVIIGVMICSGIAVMACWACRVLLSGPGAC
jgi:hypothetical protein